MSLDRQTECTECLRRQAREILTRTGEVPGPGPDPLTRVTVFLDHVDRTVPPPLLARDLHRTLRPLTGNAVPKLARALRAARRALFLPNHARDLLFDRDLLAWLPLGSCTVGVHCAVVAEALGCPRGSLVLHRHPSQPVPESAGTPAHDRVR